MNASSYMTLHSVSAGIQSIGSSGKVIVIVLWSMISLPCLTGVPSNKICLFNNSRYLFFFD